MEFPESFCWSKMGVEAGECLTTILWRKEIERRVGNGLFVWGVGTPLGESLSELKAEPGPDRVVFSVMRSRPKAIDAGPTALLLWLSFEEPDGVEHDLPPHALVVSRATTASGRTKRVHYGLVCRSEKRIGDGSVGELDSSQLVNIRSGKPVGFTQVTAAVRRVGEKANGGRVYPVNFVADLEAPGQVKLSRAVRITTLELRRFYSVALARDEKAWPELVHQLKERALRRRGIVSGSR